MSKLNIKMNRLISQLKRIENDRKKESQADSIRRKIRKLENKIEEAHIQSKAANQGNL